MKYDWVFPLPRTHTGMLLGNGTFGCMVWGEANVLRITVGRADFWDRRGGLPWTDAMNYSAIRTLLEAKDQQGLERLFPNNPQVRGEPRRPSILPIGRIELEFDPRMVLTRGTLDLFSAQAVVYLTDSDGGEYEARFDLSVHVPLVHIELSPELPRPRVLQVPAWRYVGEYLSSISFKPPEPFERDELCGWVQSRCAEGPLCVGYRWDRAGALWLAATYGHDADDARGNCATLVADSIRHAAPALRQANAQWWTDYWGRVPQLHLPNPRLEFIYRYGLYKFAGLTNPGGVAATLQGPWIEEYQMPPWSSDYHFNINVQMCYSPAYQANLPHHLAPLFKMIRGWDDTLRDNARRFVGIDDGRMLPHAVDDRCVAMGGFWSGTVDHGCTAWVAKMMFDAWLYFGDLAFLREVAYPFMRGAMRVYQAMLERRTDEHGQPTFILPLSVSPEYRGNRIDAWGVNASFQLACAHWLAEALQQAAEAIGETPDPAWAEIRQGLPQASIYDQGGKRQIGLWDGLILEESHRHHAHMGAFCPFDTIDPQSAEWIDVAKATYAHWIAEGMGLWSGWCMPWAAMLQTRAGNPDATEWTLETWQRLFTNIGHGTLHNIEFAGLSLMGGPPMGPVGKDREVMQIEAGMAACAAVMDMMLHSRRGVHYLFAGAPAHWREVSFKGIRAAGAFLVSAHRLAGEVASVTLHSECGGTFRLANPWPGEALLRSSNLPDRRLGGRVLDIATGPGQTLELNPGSASPATSTFG